MADINSIVQVTITKDTATVSRAGFGTPGFLVYHTTFPEAARSYGSLSEMVSDGFAVTDRAYLMASAAFAQSPRPASIVIGRRDNAPLRDVTLTPNANLLANTDYTLTINGTDFTYQTGASPSVAAITAALETAINAGAVDVLATDGTTELDIEKAATPGGIATAGTPFVIEFDRTLFDIVDNTADPGIAADLTAMIAVGLEFYGLASDALGAAEIEVLATAIEAGDPKIYLADSQDSDIPGSGSADIASTLQSSALDRTALCYHPAAGVEHLGPAWLGDRLPTDPGSSTWKFKTLATVASYTLSTSEQGYADGKSAQHYQPVAGNNITAEGTMSGGEFIDVTRFIDWLNARIKEDVFRIFLVNEKIPGTDLGIQTIVNAIEGVLKQGISRGGLAADPAPYVTAPRASEISAADKATRTLPDVEFQATLAGAIHKTIIAGRVTV